MIFCFFSFALKASCRFFFALIRVLPAADALAVGSVEVVAVVVVASIVEVVSVEVVSVGAGRRT